MVEHQFSKLITRVRFPSPAPKLHAHVAQSVEHFLGKEEVDGSIPFVSTSYRSPWRGVSPTSIRFYPFIQN